VGTSYDDPPDLVKRTILEVLEDTPGVLAEPRPVIYTIAYADFSINYEIKFFIDDFPAHRRIQDGVMTRLWYAFRRKGIEIPFPIRHVYHHAAEGEEPAEAPKPAALPAGFGVPALAAHGPVRPPHRRKVDIEGTLAQVPIFADLSPEERRALVGPARVLEYALGEKVIRQGDPGSTLYAIAGGTARVILRGDDKVERDVATLKEGNVFGEMSLLTGDLRSATVASGGDLVVVEVGKEALAPILAANSSLAGKIAEMMVLRKEGLDRAKAEAALDANRKKEIEAAAKTLLGRIVSFFGLLVK
jgi:CRP-like cAMP-binding protein